jgi:hypothetical protein
MSDTPNKTPEPVSVEKMINDSLCNVRQRIRTRRKKCEKRIRKSPTASVLGAVGVGYLLHRMPVRAILVTQVRILSALAPPALFLFGAAKLFSFLQREQPTGRK